MFPTTKPEENQAQTTSNLKTTDNQTETVNNKNENAKAATISPKKSSFSWLITVLGASLTLILLVALALIWLFPDSDFSQLVSSQQWLNKLTFWQSRDQTNSNKPTDIDQAKEKPIKLSPFVFAEPEKPMTTAEVVSKAIPSIVSISVSLKIRGSNVTNLSGSVAGTGFIVSPEGLVVTNKHVISSQCQFGQAVEIVGTDYTNRLLKLELLSVDPIYDIAVLKIINPPENLVPLTFVSSETVKIGSEVIAIGNALGELQNTVTKGIISGVSRSLRTNLVDECTNSPVFADGLLQTDAAINRGNSGGPLLNAAGQVVGMNTFGTTDGQNIGLAIPSNAIVSALNSYQENGIIQRPKLGVYSRTITPLLKNQEDWLPTDYGELIIAPIGQIAVERGSAADKAGLREGDIILEVNGQKIEQTRDNPFPLRRILLTFKPGDKIKLTVLKVRNTTPQYFEYHLRPTEVEVTLDKLVVNIK
jgi:S1-C subfamily serine protease